jgi:hypothetical protein
MKRYARFETASFRPASLVYFIEMLQQYQACHRAPANISNIAGHYKYSA